jgi:hypothetical protein
VNVFLSFKIPYLDRSIDYIMHVAMLNLFNVMSSAMPSQEVPSFHSTTICHPARMYSPIIRLELMFTPLHTMMNCTCAPAHSVTRLSCLTSPQSMVKDCHITTSPPGSRDRPILPRMKPTYSRRCYPYSTTKSYSYFINRFTHYSILIR